MAPLSTALGSAGSAAVPHTLQRPSSPIRPTHAPSGHRRRRFESNGLSSLEVIAARLARIGRLGDCLCALVAAQFLQRQVDVAADREGVLGGGNLLGRAGTESQLHAPSTPPPPPLPPPPPH